MSNRNRAPQTSFMPLPQGWAHNQVPIKRQRSRDISIISTNGECWHGSQTTRYCGLNYNPLSLPNFSQPNHLVEQKRRKVDEAVSSIILQAKKSCVSEPSPHCPWRGIHQFPPVKERPTSSLDYYEKSRSLTDPVVSYEPPSFADLNTSQCLNDGYEISPIASEVSFSNISEVYDETPYKVWRNPSHHRFSHSERPLIHSSPAVNRTSYNNQISLSDRTSGFQSMESPNWQFSLLSTNSYGGCSSRFGDLIRPMPNPTSQTWHQPLQMNPPTNFSQTHYFRNDYDPFPFRSKNSKFNRSNQDRVTSSTDRRCDNEVDESMNMTSGEWKGSNLSNSLINYIIEDWSPVNIEQENARARDQSRCASSQTDKTSLVNGSSQTDDRLFVCTVCRNRQDALARYPPTSSTFSQRPNNFGRLFASAQIPQNHSPTISQKANIELGKGYPLISHLSPSEHFLCKSLDLSYLNED